MYRNSLLAQKYLLTGTKVLQNIATWAVEDEPPHKLVLLFLVLILLLKPEKGLDAPP